MSKKKNTLKDLDEFLKQQAATLVSPQKLSDLSAEAPVLEESPVMRETKKAITKETLLDDIKKLSNAEGDGFRKKLYDLIIAALESQQKPTPEDTMLINTALYLKNPLNWKETIRTYWRNRTKS